mgnify:CR=1 FL=1
MNDELDVDGNIGNAEHVALQQRIVALKMEHRDLDTAIERLARDALHDELQLRRLKRRKRPPRSRSFRPAAMSKPG